MYFSELFSLSISVFIYFSSVGDDDGNIVILGWGNCCGDNSILHVDHEYKAVSRRFLLKTQLSANHTLGVIY